MTNPFIRKLNELGISGLNHLSPVPPSLVADKILEIVESRSWQLRYPVGPDAEPFWNWRASMTDEKWVDWNAQEDEDWYNAVESTFGLNCRPEKLEKEK